VPSEEGLPWESLGGGTDVENKFDCQVDRVELGKFQRKRQRETEIEKE